MLQLRRFRIPNAVADVLRPRCRVAASSPTAWCARRRAARGLDDMSARFLQGPLDLTPFGHVAGFRQRGEGPCRHRLPSAIAAKSGNRSPGMIQSDFASATARSIRLRKFPHIAGPGIGKRGLLVRGADALDRPGWLPLNCSRNSVDEPRNVVEPLPQRRNIDRHAGDAVEEILPKPPLAHQRRRSRLVEHTIRPWNTIDCSPPSR